MSFNIGGVLCQTKKKRKPMLMLAIHQVQMQDRYSEEQKEEQVVETEATETRNRTKSRN